MSPAHRETKTCLTQICCHSFKHIPRYCGILTRFCFVLSSGPHERYVYSNSGNHIHKKRRNHELDEIRFAEKCRVPSPFCVVSCRLETERNRGTVVTYVAKASSLAKTLIKPLTIIPTKPDLKAIHRVCTKESGGMQVPSHLSHTPYTPLQCHERCLLHLKAK